MKKVFRVDLYTKSVQSKYVYAESVAEAEDIAEAADWAEEKEEVLDTDIEIEAPEDDLYPGAYIEESEDDFRYDPALHQKATESDIK